MESNEIIWGIIILVIGIKVLMRVDKWVAENRKTQQEEPLDKQEAGDNAMQEAISRRAVQDFDWPILGGITLPMDVNSFLEAYRNFAKQTGQRLSFINQRGNVEDYRVNSDYKQYKGKIYELSLIMPVGNFMSVASMFINKYGPTMNYRWDFKEVTISVTRHYGSVTITYTHKPTILLIDQEREAKLREEERRQREEAAARIKERYRRADETEKLL